MKQLIILVFAVILSFQLSAQSSGAAINTSGAAADPSAILDVSSADHGLLIPRVSLASTTNSSPITNPANSLMVYNTATIGDVTPGFYYWEGTEWVRIASGAGGATPDLRAIKTMIYTNVGGH